MAFLCRRRGCRSPNRHLPKFQSLDKLVIIPTYNEKENIEKMVRRVMGLAGEFHLLVVDDGSPDGTAGIVKGLQH